MAKTSCSLVLSLETGNTKTRASTSFTDYPASATNQKAAVYLISTTKATGNLAEDNRVIVKPFPPLPFELFLAILEEATRMDKPTTAALTLVSRSVRACVLPHLFAELVITRRMDLFRLTRFLHAHEYIARHVKAMYVRPALYDDYRLFVPCAQLERVALTPGCFLALYEYGNRTVSSISPATVLDIGTGLGTKAQRTLKEQQQAVAVLPPTPHELLFFPGFPDWRDFNFSGRYTRALFAGLTHLWCTQAKQLSSLIHCTEACAALLQLTHLAVPIERTEVPNVLRALPGVRVLVVASPWSTRRGSHQATTPPYVDSNPDPVRGYVLRSGNEKHSARS